MPWVVIGVILTLVGALVYWRIRSRRQCRLIALVALLREPITFDPAILARIAGKAWKADLGDGSSEGADGFVVCADMLNTIMHDRRIFLVNNFPRPYVDDVETVAEGIEDRRLRELFRQHKAWFSCDAIGVSGATPAEEVLEWYRRLGKLFADLLDENCLLIYTPDSQRAYPINEDTEMALRSRDPLKALQRTLTAPVLEVADDDPLMKEAVEKARQAWPQFVAAFEAQAGEDFSVKAPVTQAGNTEFIWISVTCIEGDRIYGELANDPINLGSLKLGSKVSVLLADLNDWAYLDANENMTGGFTVEAIQKASRRNQKR